MRRSRKILVILEVIIIMFAIISEYFTEKPNAKMNLVRQKQIPIIFFNREPVPVNSIKAYEKAYYVGTDPKEAGMLQGKILIDLWNNSRSVIDTNNNGVLEYVILKGQQNNIEAKERTEFAISTIENAGIKTSQ